MNVWYISKYDKKSYQRDKIKYYLGSNDNTSNFTSGELTKFCHKNVIVDIFK